MKNYLMPTADKIPLRRHFVIETALISSNPRWALSVADERLDMFLCLSWLSQPKRACRARAFPP